MSRCLRIVTAMAVLAVALVAAGPAQGQDAPPTTGFEDSGGATWTTHEEELAFLEAVDAASDRVEVDTIGETAEGRPLHLVQIGAPAPRTVSTPADGPTVLYVCSQHGNEPAGREACLQTLRDLAFSEDPEIVEQMSEQTILFVPAANPDGRAADTRTNSDGFDINRDHLNLETPEARAVAGVVRDWHPNMVIDLHEYGPSTPILYDDEIQTLWPRNLNVDQEVHDLAKSFVLDTIEPCAEDAGYTADEYGQYAVGDVDVEQTAGDGDEGILRNTMGLRHAIGVLVETAVSADITNGPDEILSEAAVQQRRVDAHATVTGCSLRFLREHGEEVMLATEGAPSRKRAEGSAQDTPVYFDGADNEEPSVVAFPPPCGYLVGAEDAAALSTTLELHGVTTVPRQEGVWVPMGQAAEPVIPLLLDARGLRHGAEAEPLQAAPVDEACAVPAPAGGGEGS